MTDNNKVPPEFEGWPGVNQKETNLWGGFWKELGDLLKKQMSLAGEDNPKNWMLVSCLLKSYAELIDSFTVQVTNLSPEMMEEASKAVKAIARSFVGRVTGPTEPTTRK